MIEKIINEIYKPSISWEQANIFVKKIEREAINKNVDDIVISIFEGDYKKEISKYRNLVLIETLLLCFVWHRIHRAVFWDSSTEVYTPLPEKLEKITAIIDRVGKHLPSNGPLLSFSRFLVLCIKSDYHKCSELVGVEIPPGCYLEYYMVGINSFRFPINNPQYVREVNIPDVKVEKCVELPLFLLSCDEVYYENFHDEFISSARDKGFKNTIVFLVLGKDNEVFYNKKQDFYKINVTTDVEYSPALFASARFLLANKIIDIFDRDLFIFDIDFNFSSVSLESLETYESYDIGLSFNRYGRAYVPWSSISAATCFFSNSNFTQFFLRTFAFYIYENYGAEKWWIDQNALFYAFQKSRVNFPSVKVFNMIKTRDAGVTNHLLSVSDFKKINSSR